MGFAREFTEEFYIARAFRLLLPWRIVRSSLQGVATVIVILRHLSAIASAYSSSSTPRLWLWHSCWIGRWLLHGGFLVLMYMGGYCRGPNGVDLHKTGKGN
jgi:hypothetical protein